MSNGNMKSGDKSSLLIEFDPPQFLLSNETVNRIVDEFTASKKVEADCNIAKERAISIGVSFAISIFCSFEALFGNIPNTTDKAAFAFYIIRVLAMAGIAFWLGSCIIKYFFSKKEMKCKTLNIQTEMKAGAKEKINYTAILIIATMDERGIYKLFVDKRGKNEHAYFLPYCSMDKRNTIQYQSERIKSFLSGRYGLKKQDILEVIDLSEEPTFSIKSTRSGNAEEQHAFAFFRICLVPDAKKMFNDNEDGGWYTINDLKENPQAVERNGDVINKLDECPEYIADSFEGKRRPPLKIIWNITKKCGYMCEICATHDDSRQELSLEQKIKALQSILTIKDRIGILDFAGGDPCKSDDSLLVVQEAIHTLGQDHISITTTGDGIKSLDVKRRKALLKQCEITIDVEHPNSTDTIKRAAEGYVESNVDKLVTYGDETQNLTINMPIIHTDLSTAEIENIVQEIIKIKETNKNVKIQVSFLRLMPVGKVNREEYPEAYSPWSVIKEIRERLEPHGISCTSHCSLNVCAGDEEGTGCGRLKVKLGIDCAGNVFACAWAGYLTSFPTVQDNPFYIGNLLNMDLSEMLSEQSNQNGNYKKMCKYDPKEFSHCPLISYVNNKKDPHKNSDPLSEKKTAAK